MPRVKPITARMVATAVLSTPELHAAALAALRIIKPAVSALGAAVRVCRSNLLKSVWLASHFTCAAGFPVYVLFRSSVAYRATALGAAATYAFAELRHVHLLVRGQRTQGVPLAAVVNSENTLLLAAALLHLSSAPSALKLVSFAVFAHINLLSYALHEAHRTSVSNTLLPVLTCLEPAALAMACYADYAAQLVYLYEAFCSQTLLLWALVFFYLGAKRLELSELARASLHGYIEFCLSVAEYAKVPLPVLRVAQRGHQVVCALVPIAASMAQPKEKRVASLILEPVEIINDMY